MLFGSHAVDLSQRSFFSLKQLLIFVLMIQSQVFHSHPNLKCSTCRLLHCTVYKNNSQDVLQHFQGLQGYFYRYCSVCKSLSITSIPAAAHSGWATAVDQTWKRSVNGVELKLESARATLGRSTCERVWNSDAGISSIKSSWKAPEGPVWRTVTTFDITVKQWKNWASIITKIQSN